MTSIFATTLPFFALVFTGWLAARQRWLPIEAVPGLNAFVLWFALPAMLLRLGLQLPLGELLHPALLGVYALAACVLVAFVLALMLGQGLRMKAASFDAFAATYPNNGFMGLPLTVSLLGPAAAGPLMGAILVDVFLTTTLCVALANTDHERDTLPSLDTQGGLPTHPTAVRYPDNRLAARLDRSLRAALLNPLPWAILLGAGLRAGEVTLPGPVARFVGMLADAASPVALFTIGAVLRRAQVAVQDPSTRLARRQDALAWRRRLREGWSVVRLALFKLLLHPLLMLVLGLAARQLGAELTLAQVTCLVLVAALPSASSVAMWSERYQADTARVVHVIMVSTALAFVSFTLVAAALTGGAPR